MLPRRSLSARRARKKRLLIAGVKKQEILDFPVAADKGVKDLIAVLVCSVSLKLPNRVAS